MIKRLKAAYRAFCKPIGYKGTKKKLYVFGEQTIQGNIKRGENENSP